MKYNVIGENYNMKKIIIKITTWYTYFVIQYLKKRCSLYQQNIEDSISKRIDLQKKQNEKYNLNIKIIGR